VEIILALLILLLLLASAGLAWFFIRAREEGLSARLALAAAQRSLEESEQRRKENIDAVKAAALEAAQGFSSKLLDDHKRESQSAKEEAEKRVREHSEGLVKQVDTIAKALAALHGQLQEKGETIDMLWQALQSPSGAGAMAEIGLANTLRAFGLEPERDFVLQYTTEDEVSGRRLRPDAIVFLPGDSVLVIDCKASKFILEIAQAEGTEREAEAYANLARTMNLHLRALIDKDYASAVLAAQRQAGRGASARIFSMMYLPNEAAVEKLRLADGGFLDRAHAANIILGGPSVLYCALSLASKEITLARQVENHEKIVERTRNLLDGIGMALGHAVAVGKNLQKAAESFDAFSRSTNRFLLPRARNLLTLGLRPAKPLPTNLPSFAVHSQETTIEGEAEELEALESGDTEISSQPRLVK